MSISRRRFLKSATFAGTAVGLGGMVPLRRVLGANSDIRVAVIGLNGRGESHIQEFSKMAGVRLAALCDVDLRVLERRAQKFPGIEKYQDVRRLLASKEIDAVSIATP